MLLTRSPLREELLPLSVRLACIRHAAGVYPEPGSNSQKYIFLKDNSSLPTYFSGLTIIGSFLLKCIDDLPIV